MPKIINLNSGTTTPLTVDSTIITVDTTEYTADQTFILGGRLLLKVTPMEYPTTIYLTFWNELKQKTTQEVCYPTNENGYMVIPFTNDDFEEGDDMEMTIRKDSHTGKVILRDKAYVTMAPDLENYRINLVNNRGVIEL